MLVYFSCIGFYCNNELMFETSKKKEKAYEEILENYKKYTNFKINK